MHQRARAHRARLLRHVQIALIQPPIADHTLRLRDRQHLRMGRRILQRLHLVVSPRDDFALVDDDGADRHLLLGGGALCLAQGLAHEVGVTVEIDHWPKVSSNQ